jgi:predicted Zn-dependent peptidase
MDLEPAPLDANPTPAAAVRSGRHAIRVDRLESARLLMLWSTAGAADQDMVMGADLATTLLAEGRRSRLVGRLRETLRIAETVDMDLTVLEQGSLVTLEICCREEDLANVERELETELARSLHEPPAEWELNRARQLVGNGLRYSLESTAQVAGTAGSQQLWKRQQDLLQPLQVLNDWSADRLLQELMPTLSSDRACTLIATPGAAA